jgi:hypothetical protein
MRYESKSTEKLEILLESIKQLFPPEKLSDASYFEINWSHDGSGDISAPGCTIGFKVQDYITTLPAKEPMSEDEYNKLREIALKHNIRIVVPPFPVQGQQQ